MPWRIDDLSSMRIIERTAFSHACVRSEPVAAATAADSLPRMPAPELCEHSSGSGAAGKESVHAARAALAACGESLDTCAKEL